MLVRKKSIISTSSSSCFFSPNLFCFFLLILCSLFTYFLIQTKFQNNNLKYYKKTTKTRIESNLIVENHHFVNDLGLLNISYLNNLFEINLQVRSVCALGFSVH